MNLCNIFYSWQSDLPNPTNRGFIGKALQNVAKEIQTDEVGVVKLIEVYETNMKYPFVRVGPKKEGAVKYANK